MSDNSNGPFAVKRQDRITHAVFPVRDEIDSFGNAVALAGMDQHSEPMRDLFFVTDKSDKVVFVNSE